MIGICEQLMRSQRVSTPLLHRLLRSNLSSLVADPLSSSIGDWPLLAFSLTLGWMALRSVVHFYSARNYSVFVSLEWSSTWSYCSQLTAAHRADPVWNSAGVDRFDSLWSDDSQRPVPSLVVGPNHWLISDVAIISLPRNASIISIPDNRRFDWITKCWCSERSGRTSEWSTRHWRGIYATGP